MDPGYFLLCIIYLALLAGSLRLTRGRFSPAIAFFATWSFPLGLLSLGSIHPDYAPPALSRATGVYLVLTGAIFFSGAFFAHSLGPPRASRHRIPASDRLAPAQRDSFNLAGLQILALVTLIFTALYVVREAPDLRSYLSSARAIREQLTETTSRTSGLAALATYAALIVIPVGAIYWLRRRRIRWWMIVPVLSVTLLALLSIGKFLFIFLGLTFLNLAWYQRVAQPTRRTSRGSILAVVAAIFCSFFVITELRTHSDDGTERPPRSGLVFTLYDYATGYVPAFDRYYGEYLAGEVTTSPTIADYSPGSGRPGNQTFSGIYRLMSQLGLVTQSASNRYEGSFNVYTIHRDLIMDFGVPGSLALTFLTGFSMTLFYRLCDWRNVSSIILLALLTTQMEFSLIYSLFGFIFYPVLLVVSPLLAGRRGNIQEAPEPGKTALASPASIAEH